MKIAYLVNQYPHVSHTFIRREIAALEALGVEIARYAIQPVKGELVDPADRAELPKTEALLSGGPLGLVSDIAACLLSRPGATLQSLRLALRISRGSDRGVLRHIAYWAEACRLKRRLRAGGAEHLHAHFATNSAAVAMLCRTLGGPPYSFTVHGQKGLDLPGPRSLPEKVRRARFVATVSHFGRSQIYLRTKTSDWPKVHVVRCGLDAQELKQTPDPVPDVPRLVSVGRLSHEKGHLLLIEAARLLANEGVSFELVLVGDGEMRPQVEEAIARANLGDRVRITGWASSAQVRQEVQAARVLVLPSFIEGLPVVIMEAFAMGRPVVAPWIAGIPELVEPGRNGWLFPPADAASLANGMKTALTTEAAVLTEMGAAGRARVLEQHDLTSIATLLRQLLAA